MDGMGILLPYIGFSGFNNADPGNKRGVLFCGWNFMMDGWIDTQGYFLWLRIL